MKNFLLIILCFVGMSSLFGQTITALGSPFQAGTSLTFDYSGGTGATTDWIGIYPPGEVPDGDPVSTIWYYINTSSGQIIFDGTLPNGEYDIHMFCCDSYTILATTHFTIEGAAPATIGVTSFPITGKPFTFDYSGGTGSPTDWIGVYAKGALPGTDGSLSFQYVPSAAGSLAFTDTLPAGEYDVHLFCCDVYTILASSSFVVYPTSAPVLTATNAITNTDPINWSFSGGTGSYVDWIGIYPHGEIPDGDPAAISYQYVNGPNGELVFEPVTALVPGMFYDAHLFCCDGYEILASYTNFSPTSSSTLDGYANTANFKIQPSPAHDLARIVFSEPVKGTLSIHNSMGQMVQNIQINNESILDVKGLTSGNYVARYQDGKGVLQMVKFVVL